MTESTPLLLEPLFERIRNIRDKYNKSAKYYNKMNWYLNLPAIVVSSACSVLSFVSTSNIIPSEAKIKVIFATGVLTAIVSLLQTLNSAGEFSLKKSKFIEATSEIDALVDKIFFEMQHHDEEDFINIVEEELRKIKINCKYLPI